MTALIRRLLGLVPGVTRSEAIETARVCAQRNGWPWEEPLHVEEGVTAFHVRTNAQMRGGNVNVRVRRSDGAIIKAAFAAR